jgi:hypothetical protein
MLFAIAAQAKIILNLPLTTCAQERRKTHRFMIPPHRSYLSHSSPCRWRRFRSGRLKILKPCKSLESLLLFLGEKRENGK